MTKFPITRRQMTMMTTDVYAVGVIEGLLSPTVMASVGTCISLFRA